VSRALFAGSFDPVTMGHVDLVQRASPLFDEVLVAVADNPAKRTWFTVAERIALFEAAIEAPNVRVVRVEGLLVHAARDLGATVLLRGLRGPADLDLELRNGLANRDQTGIETLLLPTSPQWSFVSSSLVKEIARYGGSVGAYLPAASHAAVLAHLERASSAS